MSNPLLLLPYTLYLLVVVRPYFQILRKTQRYGGGRVQYTTREFLAVSFGLIPTAVLTAWFVQENADGSRSLDLVAVATTFIFWSTNQIAGMLVMLMTGLSPSRRHGAEGDSSGMILFGALMGLTLPLVGWLLILINMNERAKNSAHEPRELELKAQQRRKFRKGLRQPGTTTAA